MSFLMKNIEYYPKKTLEASLKELIKSRNKIIGGKFSPKFFGFDYEEIQYYSENNIKLYGWLIKQKNATKTLVLVHGRKSNRIFCIRYLRIFKENNLSDYNIFIPDLRNSGKSDTNKTAFGYKFAVDLWYTLDMLKKRFNYNNFTFFAFSQGAMASSILTGIYKEKLKENNIIIEKMILDSPIANVKKIIKQNAKIKNIRIPLVITNLALYKFNKSIDNNLNKLRLSYLLGNIPTLIIQSEKDNVTLYDDIVNEYQILKQREKNENIAKTNFKAFRKGLHVRTYLEFYNEYVKTVVDFLKD